VQRRRLHVHRHVARSHDEAPHREWSLFAGQACSRTCLWLIGGLVADCVC
jgi:hypothetical protein